MHYINRRSFIGSASIAAAALAQPYKLFARFGQRQYVDIKTALGTLRGSSDNGVNTFLGIPYAGRVSGDRRFKRPAELEPWAGVRDALELGAPAIQPPRQNEPVPSEDCLFLNIWSPAGDGGNAGDQRKYPVMFYSHGGGYVTGSAGSRAQNGENLARHFGVVVVETNHRLGLLGFLYLDEVAGAEYAGSGNTGLLDITTALKWVRENIAAFGGDPNNVMIFGESGGGGKTSSLYAMPEAAPYFNKASIESGPGVHIVTQETAARTTAHVLQELHISRGDWRKLLNVPAPDLLALQSALPTVAPNADNAATSLGFGPVVDSKVLFHHPFDPVAPDISRNKPLIVGWNEDEYTFFAWQRKDTSFTQLEFASLEKKLEKTYGTAAGTIVDTYRHTRPDATAADLFVAISSVTLMGLGSITIAERKSAQQGAPVYLYNFGYKSEVKIPDTNYALGTPHAMDITFKFNNEQPGDPPGFFSGARPDRFAVSHTMAEFWTTFAGTGKPEARSAPAWTPYSKPDHAMMRIDTKSTIIDNRYAEEIAMWRSIGKL